MQLTFSEPVREHHFKLRCFPLSDERQKILNERVEIYPVHFSSKERDSFGNLCVYGTTREIHQQFSVNVEGEAEIAPHAELKAETFRAGVFRYATELTRAGESIRDFYESFDFPGNMTDYERALCMMSALHENFTYSPGVTGVGTTAEQAMTLGRGVCQDYAHILLSLCRLERIPCRYIAGMIQGEGATHAWTEIYDSGIWRMIDPTHNRTCDDTYIKISSGRDAKDCAINQGVFYGGGRQTQTVRVSVNVLT